MAYEQFFIEPLPNRVAYTGADKSLGYPGLQSIAALQPDFVVGTGDTVYYDWITSTATTEDEMRQRWREQAVLPRFVELFGSVCSYWQKDDHDYRYNDADPFGSAAPSAALGAAIFLEQVPIVAVGSSQKTFRTHRLSHDIQIWLTEGRDFRSTNSDPDGPNKSLWGPEQFAWLQKSFLDSDARHFILINPGPMVGPDFASKNDNHTNPAGFTHERDQFFDFLVRNRLIDRVTLICGDRHWPYHSISPEGVHELCSGVLTEGCEEFPVPRPGDSFSTDPNARVSQSWITTQPISSFAEIVAAPGRLTVRLRHSQGQLLHSADRMGN